MVAQPVLSFDRVSKWYGPVIGLNEVSLELHHGITGLVGPNGAGKSTLIRLATGQIQPSMGTVLVQGVPAWNWQAKQLIGYCPDHDSFFEDISGRSFVLAMARLNGFRKQEARTRTEEVLQRVTMGDRADRKIRGYSKGMRQRIKLAVALLNNPPLLVLDEPLSGIDPVGRQEMLQLFRTLADEGRCLLISSHELEELEKLTEQMAILTRSRLAAFGTMDVIRAQLNDQPLTLRIDTPSPRDLAGILIHWPEVVSIECPIEADRCIVRVHQTNRFLEQLTQEIARTGHPITRLEPLDDSTQAVLEYLLDGK
ncbi:MAG: ABC transporter ATP-binding protein [Zavarzinella sp.]